MRNAVFLMVPVPITEIPEGTYFIVPCQVNNRFIFLIRLDIRANPCEFNRTTQSHLYQKYIFYYKIQFPYIKVQLR